MISCGFPTETHWRGTLKIVEIPFKILVIDWAGEPDILVNPTRPIGRGSPNITGRLDCAAEAGLKKQRLPRVFPAELCFYTDYH